MKTLSELNHLIFVYLPPLWGKEIEQKQRFSFVFSEKDLTPYLPSCWWLVQSHRLVVSRVCFLHSFSEFLFIWNSQYFLDKTDIDSWQKFEQAPTCLIGSQSGYGVFIASLMPGTIKFYCSMQKVACPTKGIGALRLVVSTFHCKIWGRRMLHTPVNSLTADRWGNKDQQTH